MTYNRNTIERMEQMTDALKASPHRVEDLCELTGLSVEAVRRWLKAVRKKVYIADYGEDARGRMFAPRWAWGRRKDAERPGQQRTAAERMRDVRARRKAQSNEDLFG